MGVEYEAVIGLEIHAELGTKSKMFCACRVVDSTLAQPNVAVCPVCAGMPGVLPVINRQAVEYAIRVALALDCEIAQTSIFARKNYFYPDLPKGYQISQYEQPLAQHGKLTILTSQGERQIRVRRVHLEEDTGKLTHCAGEQGGQDPAHEQNGSPGYSLVDLNRAGVPLLEIVSEPDLHTAEEVRAYAMMLRSILRYLAVNSGDMQKGVMRIEPNVSVRPIGTQKLGTRTEIKNLNSFKALERGVEYEIKRQVEILEHGGEVKLQTVGWDENRGETFLQRSKEEADDYRYFPEPDLPPLVVEQDWIESVRKDLPELPLARMRRFQEQYHLNDYDAGVLTVEQAVADYFEETVSAAGGVPAKVAANWITGDLFSLQNQAGIGMEALKISSQAMGSLLKMVNQGEINQPTGKAVLSEMFQTGKAPAAIVNEKGLRQVSDVDLISQLVSQVLDRNSEEVASYLAGKDTVARWLFGQVMKSAKGQANPQVLQQELDRQLAKLKRNEVL